MTVHATYLRLKAKRCRFLAKQAEGWLVVALNEMAEELDGKASELDVGHP